MSNAMRFGKRSLAGVAAGALVAGVMPFIVATAGPAGAAPLTGVVGPVRATFSGTTLESVPFSQIAWTSSATLGPTDTATVTLTTAPSATAQLAYGANQKIAVATTQTSNVITNADDSDSLSTTAVGDVAMGVTGTAAAIAVAVNTAGTYGGTIQTYDNGVATDTVSFSFTTSGVPKSMVLAPATQSVQTGGIGSLAASLLDAAGNATQPASVDSVNLTSTGAAGIFKNAASATITSLAGKDDSSASGLFDGTAAFGFVNGGTAGTSTISAAPAGTLGAGGVSTQTATVTASGTVNTTAVDYLYVGSTSTGDDTGTQPNTSTTIPAGTTSVTLDVVGTTAQAGATVRFKAVASQGTPSAAAPAYVNVTLDAKSEGTATIPLGGLASTNGTLITVTQVNSSNAQVNAGSVYLGINVATRAVATSTIFPTPGGSIVAKLGTTTDVSVLVTDQFLDPVAGAVVSAYRTAASGNALSTATTDSKGIAAVKVSGATGIASGAVETYVFTALPIGAGSALTATRTLQVTYTTSGAVTSMTVALATNAGATANITNTSATPTLIPYIQPPFGGAVTTAGTGVWNMTTKAAAVALGGNYMTFTPTPTPGNAVTVTVPAGVQVSKYDPAVYATGWNDGATSVTINSGSNVYVWATKSGDHEITFTSGEITAKWPFKVASPKEAAYNVALSPATQELSTGAFGTATIAVTDVFGNPIQAATAAQGGVTISASGPVLLGGYQATADVNVGALGTATVTLISSNTEVGEATLTVVPSTTAATAGGTAAWQAGYIAPTGAAAPVKLATAKVTVKSAASAKTITIIGERATVSGKPGIKVDGTTEGFVTGDTVKPYVRFPGQTSYTEGTARPTIDGAGAFSWERKTGKKTYVYFTNNDGKVKSNSIIIPAN